MDILSQIPLDYRILIEKNLNLTQVNQLEINLDKEMESFDITPEQNNWFKALRLCPADKVKVLILGQDPYPTKGHAHGLSFSTEDFVQPFPKSLRNIFVELKRSVDGYQVPITGNLTNWAEQGVLLLNTSLTTRVGEANAHENLGWEEITKQIIQKVFLNNKSVVALLWGNQAQKFAPLIKVKEHLILETSHPSPLSSYRGFNGCNHFNEVNLFLEKNNLKKIVW
ncbi:MAG: uracil-DNA glycosylase [Psychromonas sp.]|jgi:uracil-DNA glycosylase